MKTYIAQEWQDILRVHGLNSFDDIWNCEKNKNFETHWVEEPNQRRGGWSGVVRIALRDAAGKEKVVFLKRQANHMCPSILHPIKGRPTFKREFCNIARFNKHQIPTVTPIYYSQRGKEAILMTEELTGYRPLKEWFSEWEEKGFPERALRNRIIEEVARVVGKIHRYNYKHCCLVFKHVFLSLENNEVKVSIIDLEKLRYWFWQKKCRTTDLESLIRKRIDKISSTDQWRFMKTYFGTDANKREIKAIWRKVSTKLREYGDHVYEH
ncbi:MAG: lipopolysaccharide kinase [Gammaproteobacteria bacterium]|nr:lipopolysaccharide kinase [Gammaproteobacteria bacterium]